MLVQSSSLQITKFCFNLVFLKRLTELCHLKNRSFAYFILSNSKKCLQIYIICEKVVIFATTYYAEIIEVKELVEHKLGKPANGNILYHLDDVQLKNYTDNEISQILAY